MEFAQWTKKSKCDSIIPGGITQNKPVCNLHSEPKKQSAIW